MELEEERKEQEEKPGSVACPAALNTSTQANCALDRTVLFSSSSRVDGRRAGSPSLSPQLGTPLLWPSLAPLSLEDQAERSDHGLTPLHEAARAGETGCVREVISMAGKY
ncbi:unnamed protein product [Gadus morhua 'NCC']